MITTFQRGKSSSGKTVLLSSMAENFSFANKAKNKYYLSMPNMAQLNILLENMEGIRRGVFPPGTQTGQLQEFKFEVNIREDNANVEIPELNFHIYDYAGGDITSISDLQGKLQIMFNESDQKIFVMDGFVLLHDLGIISNHDSTDFGKLDIGTTANTINEIYFFLGSLRGNSPVAFVISKWDYVKKHIDFKNLLNKLYEKCPSLRDDAPKGSVILPISAIGDDNTEDIIIEKKKIIDGKERNTSTLSSTPCGNFHFSPENVDVLLAFMFKLFIQKEIERIDRDYEKNIENLQNSETISELEEKIQKLSSYTGNVSGFKKFLGNVRSLWETQKTTKSQLDDVKKALSNEYHRLALARQNEEAKKSGDSRRTRFLSFLESMNDTFGSFTNNYPDAYLD